MEDIKSKDRFKLLIDFIDIINKNKINYSLLRGVNQQLEVGEGDVDIILSHFNENIILEHPNNSFFLKVVYKVRSFIKIIIFNNRCSLQIDLFISNIYYNNKIIFCGKNIFSNSFLNYNLKFFDENCSKIIAFVKEWINNKKIKKKYLDALKNINYDELVNKTNALIVGSFFEKQIYRACVNHDNLNKVFFDRHFILIKSGFIRFSKLRFDRYFKIQGNIIEFHGTPNLSRFYFDSIINIMNSGFLKSSNYLDLNYIPLFEQKITAKNFFFNKINEWHFKIFYFLFFYFKIFPLVYKRTTLVQYNCNRLSVLNHNFIKRFLKKRVFFDSPNILKIFQTENKKIVKKSESCKYLIINNKHTDINNILKNIR